MILQEMDIDLPCPESWFQAESPRDFEQAIKSQPGLADKTLSLSECIDRLCTDDMADDMANDPIFLYGATKLDLFTIITGQYNNSCACEALLT
jgi:hypothetical protein